MLEHVEGLLQKLELPYRILRLCGGELDYECIAKIIISDFRKGYLGKFPLEKADA